MDNNSIHAGAFCFGIKHDIEGFQKCSRQFLADEYKRMHRVCSTSELNKQDLVWGILLAKYGQKRMDEYYAFTNHNKKGAK